MSRVSSLGAFTMVAALLAGGLIAVNEALVQTSAADGAGSQLDSVEQLITDAGDVLPLVVMLLVALAVVAAISGRL